jgi:hypothetical protein
MGMTYDELTEFGRLRKVEKCGPWAMYTKLLQEWGGRLTPRQVRLSSGQVIITDNRSLTEALANSLPDRGESQALLFRACS